ncbi:MAG: hypothetical protein KKE37_01935 [Verrucomicrobia bacterium]|nr:hypothetical protein [Verrucomicrobiota bacterium]MBU4290138.1 hypothetical protein [Verrucomicrobiota bacterium]MBU4428096.1 hypothetical protein [Verrucomicrobiota bacterium]MCG2681458.1 hypothetical protein [Kiritimatiellia bacterium]
MNADDEKGEALNSSNANFGNFQSAINPTPPIPPPQEDYTPQAISWIKTFFGFSGGSIFYCLSALSILFGIVQIIGPVLSKSHVYAERLSCIGILNLYECALLVIMLLIVLWRRVTDDAVSLMVLIALFLIANGIALDQVVVDNIPIACVIGFICFALSVVKLWAMRRYISLRLDRMLLAGILLLLAWNFLMSPTIALMKSLGCNNASSLRTIWQMGWAVMLTGGILLYIHSCATPTGMARSEHINRPFLQAPGMSWIFAGILFVVGSLHQYELAYIFDLRFCFGDFIPLITLGVLMAIETMRTYGKTPGLCEIGLACVPLVLILAALWNGLMIEESIIGIGFFWYPPVILLMTAIAVIYVGLRNRHYSLMYVALAYGLGILLTAGAPHTSFHWKTVGWTLGAILLGIGIFHRYFQVAVAGVITLALSSGSIPWMIRIASDYNLPIMAPMGIVAGLGIIGLYLIYGKELKTSVVIMGAIFLTGGTLRCFGEFSPLYLIMLSGVFLAVLGAFAFWLHRNLLVSIILWIPLLKAVYQLSRTASGWRYVILSFILLAVGMYLSLRKGRLLSVNHTELSSNKASHP